MSAEGFTLLTDSEDIPVCAFQIGANALNQVLWMPVKVTNEVHITDANGFFQCTHYPILDIDGDTIISAADVTPRNNGTGVALYVGSATGDVVSRTGKFKLYSDAGLTTAVASTECKCTYYYALPVSVDSSGRLVLGASPEVIGAITGDVAHDAADSGNPLKIGGKASTAKPAAVSNGDRVNAWFDEYGQMHIILENSNNIVGKMGIDQSTPGTTNQVSTELPDAAALADGASNPITPMTGAAEQQFNGITWDRRRNNLQGTLLDSLARTETVSTADQTNYNGRGIHIILDVTSITDTPSIVLKIEGKSASGMYYTLIEGAAVTGIGTHIYKVMPWATVVANEAVADQLPRTWRVTVTHADTDSITYSVDYAIDC